MRCATAGRRSASAIAALKAQGCERILIAPLYPQYCAATTATANDAAFAALAAMRWQPAIRTLPPYHDDPAYIDALAKSVEASVGGARFRAGGASSPASTACPQRTLELGDPYHCHCQKTARLLAEALGRELTVAFQSRFGAGQVAGAGDRYDAGRAGRSRACAGWRWWRRAFRPIASRRWRRWRSAGARLSSTPAASASPICLVSTTARRASRCCA